MREYSYRCHDFSLLTPAFKQSFVAPLLPYVPWVLPANIITIISNIFVYIGFFVSLYGHDFISRIIVAVCLFLYLVGDHLDGMQAKRTKTGSALGEFCDHYLDAFNNGIILFTAFLVFQITNPILIVFILASSYLAHMSVFYEQFKTGWLTFEKLGSLEAVLLTALLIGLSAIQPIYDGLVFTIFDSYRTIDLIFGVSALGALNTFITTILRTPTRGIEVWLFVIGLLITSSLAVNTLTTLEIFVVITLYSSLYVGLVMKGHLVDGIERIPDLVVPLSMVFFQFYNQLTHASVFWILSIYLFTRIVVLVVQTFSVLKVFWVWSNPRA